MERVDKTNGSTLKCGQKEMQTGSPITPPPLYQGPSYLGNTLASNTGSGFAKKIHYSNYKVKAVRETMLATNRGCLKIHCEKLTYQRLIHFKKQFLLLQISTKTQAKYNNSLYLDLSLWDETSIKLNHKFALKTLSMQPFPRTTKDPDMTNQPYLSCQTIY